MIFYALREMSASFRDGKLRTLMAITTVSIAMLIFSGFLLVSHNLHLGIDTFRSASRIEVLLHDSAEGMKISGDILVLDGVAHTQHFTKEEALGYFRKKQGDEKAEGITDALGANPFPAFIEVKLAAGVTDPRPIANRIREMQGVSDVLFGEETVERLDRIAGTVKTMTRWIGGIMAVFIFMIVLNGIRATVYARRGEIRILRLLGATDFQLRAPHIFEGAFLGLIGSVAGLGALFAGFRFVERWIPWFEVEFIPPDRIAGAIFFACALGILGGIIAVRDALNEE